METLPTPYDIIEPTINSYYLTFDYFLIVLLIFIAAWALIYFYYKFSKSSSGSFVRTTISKRRRLYSYAEKYYENPSKLLLTNIVMLFRYYQNKLSQEHLSLVKELEKMRFSENVSDESKSIIKKLVEVISNISEEEESA